jgi:hypothetical protein
MWDIITEILQPMVIGLSAFAIYNMQKLHTVKNSLNNIGITSQTIL